MVICILECRLFIARLLFQLDGNEVVDDSISILIVKGVARHAVLSVSVFWLKWLVTCKDMRSEGGRCSGRSTYSLNKGCCARDPLTRIDCG